MSGKSVSGSRKRQRRRSTTIAGAAGYQRHAGDLHMMRWIGRSWIAVGVLFLGAQSGVAQSLEDRNDGVLIGNPLLDGPDPGRLGWFATADVGLLAAHVNNQLTAPVTIGLV